MTWQTVSIIVCQATSNTVLFILIGISMAIFGALDHNHKMFMGSLFVIVQAALVITYTKMFKKIVF